jgi:hypothetical protein
LRFRAAAACVLDVAPIHIGEAPSSASAAATACSRATGNDYIEARDGLVDVVGWGPGRDEVNADRRDLVGADGKVVRR